MSGNAKVRGALRGRSLLVWASVGVLLALGLATPAGATTFGSPLAADPAVDPVECGEYGCTALGDLATPGRGASPVDGVLVGWKLRSASTGSVSILLLRGAGPFTSMGAVDHTAISPRTAASARRGGGRAPRSG